MINRDVQVRWEGPYNGREGSYYMRECAGGSGGGERGIACVQRVDGSGVQRVDGIGVARGAVFVVASGSVPVYVYALCGLSFREARGGSAAVWCVGLETWRWRMAEEACARVGRQRISTKM